MFAYQNFVRVMVSKQYEQDNEILPKFFHHDKTVRENILSSLLPKLLWHYITRIQGVLLV